MNFSFAVKMVLNYKYEKHVLHIMKHRIWRSCHDQFRAQLWFFLQDFLPFAMLLGSVQPRWLKNLLSVTCSEADPTVSLPCSKDQRCPANSSHL